MKRFTATVALLGVATCAVAVGVYRQTRGGRLASKHGEPPATAISASTSFPAGEVLQCAGCHRQQFDAWIGSHHAKANRTIDLAQDREAFENVRPVVNHGTKTQPFLDGEKPAFRIETPEGKEIHYAQAVIAVAPLRQYLISQAGGRWQALNIAYDSAKEEWFDVNGKETRSPDDWGHWKNRGMTWNVQCASCHVTGLEKSYDEAGDKYRTTWRAMGVTCTQCHDNLAAHQAKPNDRRSFPALNRARATENCGSCHSRREELTGTFHAGEDFYDHFRPLLVDSPEVYYPDGQVRQEDFEYGSFLLSRMAHKGVTCLDCHNPHSGKTVLPIDNNALCLQCHAAPIRGGAIPIDPVAHSFHRVGQLGSRCVDCHMPQTTYMQRHARRDHGFTIPDPLLTKDTGTPNACNRCHAEQTVDWAVTWTEKWYGAKMERPSRTRARVVDRARHLDETVLPVLLAHARTEEIPAWKASLIGLMSPWADDPAVRNFATTSLRDSHPLVRAAAVNTLADGPGGSVDIKKLRADPIRLVRLDATEVSDPRELSEANTRELRQYLANISDQPAGALRRSGVALKAGNLGESELWAERAAAWNPSATSFTHLGAVLHASHRDAEAEIAFQRAVTAEIHNAEPIFTLGLFYAELGRSSEARTALLKSVATDSNFGRAWYNLGLLDAAENRLEIAASELARAKALLPHSPEPAYALATVLARQGKEFESRSVLEQLLRLVPNFAPAQQLLRSLPVR